jgi:hypothetical protein
VCTQHSTAINYAEERKKKKKNNAIRQVERGGNPLDQESHAYRPSSSS